MAKLTKAQAMRLGWVNWSKEQLEAVGIDRDRLERLVKKLSECGWEMEQMGLHMYGAAGSGCLIHESRPTHYVKAGEDREDQGSVVAYVHGHFDGGDW